MHRFLLIIVFFGHGALAQQEWSTTNKKAIKSYEQGVQQIKSRMFPDGIESFQKAIRRDPDFSEAYIRLGNAYSILGEKDSVRHYYEQYVRVTDSANQNASVLAALSSLQFEKGEYGSASRSLSHALAKKPQLSAERSNQRLGRNIAFALENRTNDSISHQMLPTAVNRFYTQYFPSVTIDNSSIFFTKRDGHMPYHDEDIVVSHFANNEWQPAVSVSPAVNSENNEGAASVSADGRVLIFTSCDEGKTFGSCDLFYTSREGMVWTYPQNMGSVINSPYWDSQPSLSADGRILFFSSNRPGGFGGRDLYMSVFEDKIWGKPVNLGSEINTDLDEVTPYIHINNETLIFSSNGHPAFGGYDIFISEKTENGWRTPVNLGNKINNHLDQLAMIISADGLSAYFSEEVLNSRGVQVSKIARLDLDTDTLLAHRAGYITGRVRDMNTQRPLMAEIKLYDLDTQKPVYQTRSDKISGQFFFVLTEGRDLGVFVTSDGYLFQDFEYQVKSADVRKPDTLNIWLKPAVAGASVILKNIYFEFDSYELDQKSNAALDVIADFLQSSKKTISIEGHTDGVGSEKYNLELSEKRAQAVSQALIKLGVKPEQIQSKGFGSTRPLFFENIRNSENRRIEFKIID